MPSNPIIEVLTCCEEVAAQVPPRRYRVGAVQRRRRGCAKDSADGRVIVHAMAAAAQAVEIRAWHPDSEEACERTGVMIGSGIRGASEYTEGALTLHERGHPVAVFLPPI